MEGEKLGVEKGVDSDALSPVALSLFECQWREMALQYRICYHI